MCVPYRISVFLQFGILPRLQLFVEFRLVVPIFDAQIDDLACGFCVGEIEGRSAVEFNVLGWDVGGWREEHFTVDVEDFHGEAAGLGDAVVEAGVTRLGAVATDDGVLGRMVEEGLLEVSGVIVDDKFAFDKTLGSRVGSCSRVRLRVQSVGGSST